MIHGTLGPMMYEPNVFTLNLEQMLSGAPLDTAIGVLQITVECARGIKVGQSCYSLRYLLTLYLG
jgi:Ca2+-dependent lipid-binding protein